MAYIYYNKELDVILTDFQMSPNEQQYFITKGDALEHIKIFGTKK